MLIFRSTLFDCSNTTLYISRNLLCHFQLFHDKWGFLLFGLLLVMFHPYKKSLYNKIDISIVFIMMAFFSLAWLFEGANIWLERTVVRFVLMFMLPIPLLYPLCLLSYHVWKNSERLQMAITRMKVAFFQRLAAHQQTETSLPQQALNEATALLENN